MEGWLTNRELSGYPFHKHRVTGPTGEMRDFRRQFSASRWINGPVEFLLCLFSRVYQFSTTVNGGGGPGVAVA
jgi:hypothetical protein